MPLLGASSVSTLGVSEPQEVIFFGRTQSKPRMVTSLADASQWISILEYPPDRDIHS